MNTQPKAPKPADYSDANAFCSAYIEWYCKGESDIADLVDEAEEIAGDLWLYHIGF